MSMGSIVFTDRDGTDHEFNFGLSEWTAFRSNIEYPLSQDFHSKLKEAIQAAQKQ